MKLFHNRYQWDAASLTPVRSMNWYLEGHGYNPNGITCIVAVSEVDALLIADRENLDIESVTVRDNRQTLIDQKHKEYLKHIRDLGVAA